MSQLFQHLQLCQHSEKFTHLGVPYRGYPGPPAVLALVGALMWSTTSGEAPDLARPLSGVDKGVRRILFPPTQHQRTEMPEEKPIRPVQNKLPVAHVNSTPSKIRPMDLTIARARAAKKNVAAPLGKRVQITFPVDKPSRAKFVRVHPDEGYRMYGVPTYQEQESPDVYFVEPDLVQALPEEIANQIKLHRSLCCAGSRRHVLHLVREPFRDVLVSLFKPGGAQVSVPLVARGREQVG